MCIHYYLFIWLDEYGRMFNLDYKSCFNPNHIAAMSNIRFIVYYPMYAIYFLITLNK